MIKVLIFGPSPNMEKPVYEKELYEEEITIGRADTNIISLNDPTVSKKHAIIVFRKGTYEIIDVGSTNGTFINNKLIPSNKWIHLNHNDEIRIGQHRISVAISYLKQKEIEASLTLIAILNVKGFVDASIIQDINRKLKILGTEKLGVIINMTDTSHITASGITFLLSIKGSIKYPIVLVIDEENENIMNMFKLAKITETFRVFYSISEAIKYVSKKR